MSTTGQGSGGGSIQGSLLRLGERREVAIYLRGGAAWVADFDNGRATLHTASEWHGTGEGRRLVYAQRRNKVEPVSPLPGEIVRRIESLHRRVDAPVFIPAMRRALVAMLAVFRHPKASVLPN